MSITSLETASPYIVYSSQTLTYFQFFPQRKDYVNIYFVYQTHRSLGTDQEKQGRSSTRKITRERIRNLGETETSSPATLCADSTAIDDQYEIIARLIIPPKELKKVRHVSHV